MLDQDTARLLVSEALKDRLSLKDDNVEAQSDSNSIVIELILVSENDKISFSGPVVDVELSSNSTYIQIKSSVQDGYELFSLLNTKDCVCSEYNMMHLGQSTKMTGSYKALLQKMTNFDYNKNQCTLGIELIKTKS